MSVKCKVSKVFEWDRGWVKETRILFVYPEGMPMHISLQEMGYTKEFWENLIGKDIEIGKQQYKVTVL